MIWKLQNIDDRLICYSARSDNISPFLRDLHRLPVESCVQYTIRSLTFQTMSNQAPSYLSDLIQQYVPFRQIRSSSDTCLPSADLKSSGRRASYQSPLLWNNSRHCSLDAECLECVSVCAAVYIVAVVVVWAGEVCTGSNVKHVEWIIVVCLFTSLIRLHCRAERAKPLLKQLRWLPVEHRIKYKIVCLCYHIITGCGVCQIPGVTPPSTCLVDALW